MYAESVYLAWRAECAQESLEGSSREKRYKRPKRRAASLLGETDSGFVLVGGMMHNLDEILK